MKSFVSGAASMCCFIAALFFFRFWRESRERLFWVFGIAFILLGVERIAIEAAQPAKETMGFYFLFRLVAFLLIIAGIIDKNRGQSRN